MQPLVRLVAQQLYIQTPDQHDWLHLANVLAENQQGHAGDKTDTLIQPSQASIKLVMHSSTTSTPQVLCSLYKMYKSSSDRRPHLHAAAWEPVAARYLVLVRGCLVAPLLGLNLEVLAAWQLMEPLLAWDPQGQGGRCRATNQVSCLGWAVVPAEHHWQLSNKCGQ
jgi:hypothetical protein